MRYLKVFVYLFALCACIAGCTPAGGLKCNIGVADITPDEPVVLAGFAARSGLSTTVHRPLKTRCLVVKDDSTTVCIISNDMMELPPKYADGLRDEIAERTGIPRGNIFIHCTHTHSAPRVGGGSAEPGGTNHAFAQKVRRVVVDNAVLTIINDKAFKPFTIETGKAQSDINCNRGEKDGPCDHDVYAARLLDKRGRPIVSLVNFACHPVSLNHRSLLVSTDFPGITVDELMKVWGGETFYFSGAAGNVNPCGPLQADTSYTQQRGLELAEAAKGITFEKTGGKGRLLVKNLTVNLPYRADRITPEVINAHVDEIRQWDVSGTWKGDVDRWQQEILERIAAGEVKNYLPFEIAAVNMDGLVLLFSQGEPFSEYQTSVRASKPGHPILFIAYTNGQNSYLPDKHAYQSTAYEYEKEQMHIYIKAPYPLSNDMPIVYETALKKLSGDVLKNE